MVYIKEKEEGKDRYWYDKCQRSIVLLFLINQTNSLVPTIIKSKIHIRNVVMPQHDCMIFKKRKTTQIDSTEIILKDEYCYFFKNQIFNQIMAINKTVAIFK